VQPGTETRRRASRHKPDPNVHRAATNLAPYPYFSQEERERRWALVRDAMDQARLDCLVVPPSGGASDELAASARYLTHVGAAGVDVSVVFPLVHAPAAITPEPALWSAAQPWCTDLRRADPSHSAAVATKLKGVGLRRRRVGIVGLGSDASGGDAPVGFLRALAEVCPRVTWVDFSSELRRIRAVKSAEELAFLRKSMDIVDAACDSAGTSIDIDRLEQDVWASIAEVLCRLGSELPIRIRWASGDAPGQWSISWPGASVTPGWLALTEIEAAWGGYRALGREPLRYEPPDRLQSLLVLVVLRAWDEVFRFIAPGIRLAELRRQAETFVLDRRRPGARELPTDATVKVIVRGCGLGADLPTLCPTVSGPDAQDDQVLVAGNCFSLAIEVFAGGRWTTWGETVAVTARGAERMGTRVQRRIVETEP
jgi:Xaa-Pro aminopeptidase